MKHFLVALVLMLSAFFQLEAAQLIGVRFEASAAPGFVDVYATSEAGGLMTTLPLARLIDLTPGTAYKVEGQTVDIPHLVVRFETFNRLGQREITSYLVRVGDQHRVALLKTLATAR